MRRVLAIGWDRKELLNIVSECEDASIRLVCHGLTNTISPDLEGHFELILINGIASLGTYRKFERLVDADRSTSYLFESEHTPPHILQQFVQDNFLWRTGEISAQKIQQCLANRDKLEWRRSQDSAAHQNFKAYLKVFHKTVGHEFHTPVNIIKTSMHLLEHYADRLSEQEKTAQFNFIAEGADRLERLISDIRLYSEFTNNLTRPQRTPIKIDELISSACTIIETKTPSAANRLSVTPPNEDCELTVDTRLFTEAFSRIVQNALENSSDTVSITAGPQVDHFSIAITDSGQGIPATEFENIFVPYARGGDIDSKQGLGLGLPIARYCIESHGGQLDVRSKIGSGSTFTIRLPLAEDSEASKLSDY